MLVYMYQASLYCESCGEKIRAELTAADKVPADPSDEYSYDSGDFPKGPERESESDSPSHCDRCDVFLETPLTSEGEEYVKDLMVFARQEGRNDAISLTVWAPFYGFTVEDAPRESED